MIICNPSKSIQCPTSKAGSRLRLNHRHGPVFRVAHGCTDSKEGCTKFITDILDDWFIEHGIPVSIRTDGGPQFRGLFKSWCGKHHIRHELASAYHHELNGHAECVVREVKKLLAKTPSYEAFRRALRSYHNCPRYNRLSPTQWYVSQRQPTDAVGFPGAYNRIPDDIIAKHEARRRKKAGKLRSHADKTSRQKMQLHPGQHVIAQHLLGVFKILEK